MARYHTSKDCFIDGRYRRAGTVFVSETDLTKKGKLPEHLTKQREETPEEREERLQNEAEAARVDAERKAQTSVDTSAVSFSNVAGGQAQVPPPPEEGVTETL